MENPLNSWSCRYSDWGSS